MSDRRRSLGRGLSALIPDVPDDRGSHASGGSTGAGLSTLPVEHIRAADHQPRTHFDQEALDELADSIRTSGLLQPIVVRRAADDEYVIIAGERRFRASRIAGLRAVPVVVREASDAEAFELALVENVQRQDLDPLEEADAYHHLVETFRMTQEQVARRVGKDRATVANALRLLKLPEPLRSLVRAGRLTAGHARALLVLSEAAHQVALGEQAAAEGWSVRETERQARALRDAPPEPRPEEVETDPPKAATPPRSTSDETVEAQLRAALGAPVRLVHRAGKGRIEVRFHSLDELERLLDLLTALEGR